MSGEETAATACLRCLSSVGQCRPHVQRYMALKISSRHGAGPLCSGWVFSFSGDDSSNQNDVCTQPEILLFYTITLPEILAFRDSFVLVVRLPGRLRCKHSPFTSGRGCSDPPPSRVHLKAWGLFWTVGDRSFWESWIMAQPWWLIGGTQACPSRSLSAAGAG